MPEIIKNNYARFACALALVAVLSTPRTGYTQSARKIEKRANTSFKNHDYYNAAKLYAAILYDSPLVSKQPGMVYPFQPVNKRKVQKVKESRRPAVQYQLAESYRLIYHYKDAVPQYEQYLASKDSQFPLARLWYGTCLLATDQPEKAIEAFNGFLQKHKKSDSLTQIATLGVADANFRISSRATAPQAVVTKINATGSTDGSNFALEKNSNDSFRFTSSRHEIDKKNEKIYPVQLYTGKINGNTVEKVTATSADGMNMGTSSLSTDGLTLYFTGWKDEKKSTPNYYRIFYTTRPSPFTKWSKPVPLPAPVNVQGYNSKQPYISRDNQHLFFASDRAGGYGKFDLWMINLDNGKINGTALNLGDRVNTGGEEASPFYDADSAYLYYSSNGKTGMGGMDIYRIHGEPKSNEWTGTATNLGSPLNSVKDDLYYTKELHTDTAYLSSDRASNCCLEIFKAVDIHYKDSANNLKNIATVQKTIVPPVLIKEDTTNNKHLPDSINAITIKRMQVNFDFASSKIRKVDYAQLNSIVQMLKKDPKLNILIASFTDCIGTQERNIRLARKRSESVKEYLLSKLIDSSRLNIDFFGKQHFLLPCREDKTYNLREQIANRRSDLIITTEKHPKWTPSGKEVDMQKNLPDSMTRMVNNQKPVTTQPSISGGKGDIGKTPKAETVTTGNKPTVQQPLGKGLDISKKQSDNSQANKENTAKNTTGNQQAAKPSAQQPLDKGSGTSKKQPDNSQATKENIAKNTTGNQQAAKPSTTTKKPSEDIAAVDKNSSRYRVDNNKKDNNRNSKPNNAVTTDKAKANSSLANNNKQKPAKNTAPATTIAKVVPQTITRQETGVTKLDSGKHELLNIKALIDPLPRLKKPGIIDQMTTRTPRKSFEVFSTSDSVRIDLYDNGVFDYDSVSVIYNKELIKFKELLQTNKPVTFYVKLDSDPKKNEMIFFAENMGLTPPNSALMVITDGENKRTEVTVSSDLQHNAVIYFIKVKKKE